MAKARKPTKAHASRAGKDMRSKSAAVRKEAGEVLSLLRRKPKKSK